MRSLVTERIVIVPTIIGWLSEIVFSVPFIYPFVNLLMISLRIKRLLIVIIVTRNVIFGTLNSGSLVGSAE